MYVPPKQKYTREVILNAAVNLAKEGGLSAVVARNVGKSLGCTVSPIFSYFSNMEDLQQAVKDEALKIYQDYIQTTNDYPPSFKMNCLQMIKFAKKEPCLFEIVFSSKGLETNFDNDIESLSKAYNISRAEGYSILNSLWIQAYGIGVLTSKGIVEFSDDEISKMLEQIYMGSIMLAKNDNDKTPGLSRQIIKVSIKK